MRLYLSKVGILQVGLTERQWVKEGVDLEKRIVEVVDYEIQAE